MVDMLDWQSLVKHMIIKLSCSEQNCTPFEPQFNVCRFVLSRRSSFDLRENLFEAIYKLRQSTLASSDVKVWTDCVTKELLDANLTDFLKYGKCIIYLVIPYDTTGSQTADFHFAQPSENRGLLTKYFITWTSNYFILLNEPLLILYLNRKFIASGFWLHRNMDEVE